MPATPNAILPGPQALFVHRFDVGPDGQPHWDMEDFCAFLGLRPAAK